MYLEPWVVGMYQTAFTWLNRWADTWVQHLGTACLSGGIFVAGVWAVCRLVPRLPIGARCWLWWLACLKLLVGLFWLNEIDVPVMPASPPTPRTLPPVQLALSFSSPALAVPPQPHASLSNRDSFPAGKPLPGNQTTPTAAPAAQEWELSSLDWQSVAYRPPTPTVHLDAPPSFALVLLFAWSVGVILCCNRIERRLRRLRVMLCRASPAVEASCVAPTAEMARLLRLRREPRVLISAETVSPLVTGLIHPTIVLPAPAPETLSPSEARMVLAHELAHVRRGDLWLAWVPLLTHGLFFFFPPLWLAIREWMAAREVACDAAAMRLTGASVPEYGHLLIRIASSSGPYQPAGALYATGAYVDLRRRVELIKRFCRNTGSVSRPLVQMMGTAAALCLVPWHVTSRPFTPMPNRHTSRPIGKGIRYRITDLSGNSLRGAVYPVGISATGLVYGGAIRVSGPTTGRIGMQTQHLWLWDRGKTEEIPALELSGTPHLSVDTDGRITGLDRLERRFVYDHGKVLHPDTVRPQERRTDEQRKLKPDMVHLRQGKRSVDLVLSREIARNIYGQRIVSLQAYDWSGVDWEDDYFEDHGVAIRLGYLPGDFRCSALGINRRGVVLECSEGYDEAELRARGGTTTFYLHAVLWYRGRIANLGALPGRAEMHPAALNDANQVVGWADGGRPGKSAHAFLFHAGGVDDLNNLIPADSGWQLTNAFAINNAGQILGVGTRQGKEHYLLLSPCP